MSAHNISLQNVSAWDFYYHLLSPLNYCQAVILKTARCALAILASEFIAYSRLTKQKIEELEVGLGLNNIFILFFSLPKKVHQIFMAFSKSFQVASDAKKNKQLLLEECIYIGTQMSLGLYGCAKFLKATVFKPVSLTGKFVELGAYASKMGRQGKILDLVGYCLHSFYFIGQIAQRKQIMRNLVSLILTLFSLVISALLIVKTPINQALLITIASINILFGLFKASEKIKKIKIGKYLIHS